MNGWPFLYGFLVVMNGAMLISDGVDKSRLFFLTVGAIGLGLVVPRPPP